MSRLILLATLLLLLCLPVFAQTEQIVIPDSCLNADTLQIIAEHYQPASKTEEANLTRVIFETIGNRMMLLEYSRRKIRNDLSFGFWQYYFKILGVFVGQTDLTDGKFSFHYVRLKSNNYLRRTIPKVLKHDHPDLDFKWN